MPYIITTSEPFDAAVHVHRPAFTRRAVATLDQARGTVNRTVLDAFTGPVTPELKRLNNAACWLPEAGGTIGPLPDGTVIEVARATLPELARAAGVPLPDFSQRTLDGTPLATGRIIDAYNAAQA